VDAAVAPGRVLVGEAEDKSAELRRGRGTAGWATGLCPVSCDASAVPAEQGVGCDDPAFAQAAGERGCDCAEQGPVVIGEFGAVDLAAQDAELVAQDDDFDVLRST